MATETVLNKLTINSVPNRDVYKAMQEKGLINQDELYLVNGDEAGEDYLANPAGGTAGQLLTKTTDGATWKDAPTGLPEGGSEGQVLTKTADGEAWVDAPVVDISGKLDETGNGSNVTATFTTASSRVNIATGEKLSVLLGKIAKWLGDLKALAFKDKVAKTDLTDDVQESLGKADSALQEAPVTSVNGQTGAVEIQTGGDVFWATKDVTTYAEIAAAVSAGKIVAFKHGDVIYHLTCIWSSYAFFTTLNSGQTSYDGNNIPKGIQSPVYRVSSSDNTWLYQNGNIATGEMTKPLTRKVTLTASGWNTSTKQYTVPCGNILADTTKQEIRPIPVDTSYNSAWKACGIECVAQAANSLTFQCATVPTTDIEVYVVIQYLTYLS